MDLTFAASCGQVGGSALGILLLTVHHEPGRVVEGLAAGANDYLRKPFVTEELRARVDALARTIQLVQRAELAETALRTALNASRTMAEAIPQQVWTTNSAGEFDFVNDRVLEYFGSNTDKVLGSGWMRFVHPEDVAAAATLWTASLSSGEPYEAELRLMRYDGAYRWHLSRAVPMRGKDGAIAKWFGTNTDVDEQKRTREELRHRSEFEKYLLGIVSHDLRIPLNVITLGAAALAGCDLDAKAAKTVLRMQAAGQRSARMISDLLDFTQARLGGGLPISRRSMNLHDLANEVLDDLRIAHSDRDLQLHVSGNGMGSWDGDRVAQLLINLISNAVHYGSAAAPVLVAIEEVAERVQIKVHNRGEPIAPDLLPAIFQPLQRGTNLANRTGRSVGLGLYIVSEIAKVHGGSIEVISNSGDGTTFLVSLPRYATENASV